MSKKTRVFTGRQTLCLSLAATAISLSLMAATAVRAAETPANKAPATLSLTLEESVNLAVKNNSSLQAGALDLKIAEDKLAQAKAQRKVTVGLGGGLTHMGGGTDLSVGDISISTNDTLYNLSLQASKPIYQGGRLKALEEQAQLGLERAAAGYEEKRDSLVLSVKKAYFGLAKAERMEGVAAEALAQSDAHLDVANKFLKAGTVPRYDVLRAQTQVAQMRQNLVSARNGVRLAASALNSLMGIPQDTPLQLKLTPAAKPVVLSLQELIDMAARERPELRSLELAARISVLGKDVVLSASRPNVSAAAGVDLYRQDAYGQGAGNWSVNFSLNMSLFDSGLTQARLQEVADSTEQLMKTVEDVRRNISLQVRQSYLQVQEKKELIDASGKALVQAEEGNRIAAVRYQSGVSTGVELLDAQTALIQARTNYYNALSDYEIAFSELERAVSNDL